jgi:hypothetical protein
MAGGSICALTTLLHCKRLRGTEQLAHQVINLGLIVTSALMYVPLSIAHACCT